MSKVADRLEEVRARIAAAARRSGRDPAGVRLVAVSKTVPASVMREAIAAGQREFGENRVQEAVGKRAQLAGEPGLRWHFIGPLQRNKVKALAGWIDLIHSVDRPELAEEIDRRGSAAGPPGQRVQEVLVEVNLTADPGHGGVGPGQVPGLLEAVAGLPQLRVVGLMAMAPQVAHPEEARAYFRRLCRLRVEVSDRFPSLGIHHLSMGMSQDYEVAVEEGATLVRVGEAVFGPRPGRAAARPAGGVVESASNVRGR